MTSSAMDKLIDAYLTDLDRQPGFWRGERAGAPVFVFCDDAQDRMRIMSPIGVVEQVDPDLLHVLLQANYDRALDARYAMRGRELWSVVVHPLATLATDDLPSLFDQVVALVKNTGTTFASTDLVFTTTADQDLHLETEEYDDEDEFEDEDDDDSDDASGPHGR